MRGRSSPGRPFYPSHSETPRDDLYDVFLCSLIFGLITVVTGILGVGAGVEISKRYRKVNPRADPIVCACGMLSSAPFLYLALVFADTSLVATYVSNLWGDPG